MGVYYYMYWKIKRRTPLLIICYNLIILLIKRDNTKIVFYYECPFVKTNGLFFRSTWLMIVDWVENETRYLITRMNTHLLKWKYFTLNCSTSSVYELEYLYRYLITTARHGTVGTIHFWNKNLWWMGKNVHFDRLRCTSVVYYYNSTW